MLYPRIIPVLLMKEKGLLKTVKFKDPKYVGDPLNAVRIFNEKEVDELTVLDIGASAAKTEPNFKLIEEMASECRMPLCYGGGIKNIDQAKRILSSGVEKVAMSSVVFENPSMISKLSEQVGSQSVVVVLDVKKRMFGGKYDCYVHNGTTSMKMDAVEMAQEAVALGAGEIVINSIDQDGMMTGYDLDLVRKIKAQVPVPVTALGGAGSLENIEELIRQEGIIGAAAGSFFVFKGKYRAVLINYPKRDEKVALLEKAMGLKFGNLR